MAELESRERAEGQEKKKKWEKRAKESPSYPAGKFAKYLTGAHDFIGLILGTEKRKKHKNPHWLLYQLLRLSR